MIDISNRFHVFVKSEVYIFFLMIRYDPYDYVGAKSI